MILPATGHGRESQCCYFTRQGEYLTGRICVPTNTTNRTHRSCSGESGLGGGCAAGAITTSSTKRILPLDDEWRERQRRSRLTRAPVTLPAVRLKILDLKQFVFVFSLSNADKMWHSSFPPFFFVRSMTSEYLCAVCGVAATMESSNSGGRPGSTFFCHDHWVAYLSCADAPLDTIQRYEKGHRALLDENLNLKRELQRTQDALNAIRHAAEALRQVADVQLTHTHSAPTSK